MKPYFENNKNCFVFSTNDGYAIYLAIALFSMKKHALAHENYDVYVLYTDLTKENIRIIQSLQSRSFFIRFVNINKYLSQLDSNIFITHAHFTKEAYYRFFIPQIFMEYDKAIYFDCDLIFLENIHSVTQIDLQNMPLAAVLEYKFKCRVEYDPVLRNYAHEILKLKNVQNYFNSGFLIFDIQQLYDSNFTQKCIEKLMEVQRPRTVDQCILNSLMQDKVLFLNPCWNLQTHVDNKELKMYVSQKDYTEYMKAFLKPKVIHYCSPQKPWNTPDVIYGTIWQKYAQDFMRQ